MKLYLYYGQLNASSRATMAALHLFPLALRVAVLVHPPRLSPVEDAVARVRVELHVERAARAAAEHEQHAQRRPADLRRVDSRHVRHRTAESARGRPAATPDLETGLIDDADRRVEQRGEAADGAHEPKRVLPVLVTREEGAGRHTLSDCARVRRGCDATHSRGRGGAILPPCARRPRRIAPGEAPRGAQSPC